MPRTSITCLASIQAAASPWIRRLNSQILHLEVSLLGLCGPRRRASRRGSAARGWDAIDGHGSTLYPGLPDLCEARLEDGILVHGCLKVNAVELEELDWLGRSRAAGPVRPDGAKRLDIRSALL